MGNVLGYRVMKARYSSHLSRRGEYLRSRSQMPSSTFLRHPMHVVLVGNRTDHIGSFQRERIHTQRRHLQGILEGSAQRLCEHYVGIPTVMSYQAPQTHDSPRLTPLTTSNKNTHNADSHRICKSKELIE